MKKLLGFLRLMRPANIVTAIADILAGVAIAGYHNLSLGDKDSIGWLVLSTIGLYGGGVVMNDVFDAKLDKVERPERPIPSGLLSIREATALGISLLFIGVFASWMVSNLSTIVALVIAFAALIYDKWSKHHTFLGPVNMGLCRGLNLLLGVSIVHYAFGQYWFVGLIPLIYIAAVTLISQGEVHGGKKGTLYIAAALYALVMFVITLFSLDENNLPLTMLFIFVWAALVFPPLRNALKQPTGPLIGRSVKMGVLGLIAMNASWAGAFGEIYFALVIISLLPFSIILAKVFAVT